MNTSCSRCDRPVLAKGLCASHYQSARMAAGRAQARAVVRTCAQCQREFSGRDPRSIYCSRECNDAASNLKKRSRLLADRPARICRWCSNAIDPTRDGRTVFCSPECNWKFQNKRNAEERKVQRHSNPRACIHCGGTISADRRSDATYCSQKCRKVVLDARWRAKSAGVNRQRLYGITPEEHKALFAQQGERCAICGSAEPRGKGWHVDHDHVTDRVRGILCHKCNVGLGNFDDDPARLQAAIDYVSR